MLSTICVQIISTGVHISTVQQATTWGQPGLIFNYETFLEVSLSLSWTIVAPCPRPLALQEGRGEKKKNF